MYKELVILGFDFIGISGTYNPGGISLINQKPAGSSSSSFWTLTKCSPPSKSFPSSNIAPSARCTSSNFATKYCVLISASIVNVLLLRSALKPATSVPANQLAKAFARDVRITIPCTNVSAGRFASTGQRRPTPILSGVILPPGRNSAKGRPTKAKHRVKRSKSRRVKHLNILNAAYNSLI